ncbi:MAG: type II toxin-antitoxin system VapC family toxin [Sulfurimicrobium sp.]|nr:type II toxin-antitoxin system VapC family toxin [Sulfurimicrobium sp.]
MQGKFLIDTDVLIDYLRDQQQAVVFLESLDSPFYISAITIAELFAGVRDGDERTNLSCFLDACATIELDLVISEKGGLYRRDYGKSHGVGLADALIAATATRHDLTVVTLNGKHYPMLKNVLIPYRKS